MYVSHDGEASGSSLTGLPGKPPTDFTTGDWIIRESIDQSKDADALGGTSSSELAMNSVPRRRQFQNCPNKSDATRVPADPISRGAPAPILKQFVQGVLTEGVVKAMFVTKIKSVLAEVLVVVALAGAAGLIYQTQARSSRCAGGAAAGKGGAARKDRPRAHGRKLVHHERRQSAQGRNVGH